MPKKTKKVRKPLKASLKAKRAFQIMVGNGGKIGPAMIEAGYSPATADTPGKLTSTKSWQELVQEFLPDSLLAEKHEQLLRATHLEHMVFPPGAPDEEIKTLLSEVNCHVRKIRKSEMQKHVWFWARDNRAVKDGLDLAYKLKGSFAPEKKEFSGTFSLVNLMDSMKDAPPLADDDLEDDDQ